MIPGEYSFQGRRGSKPKWQGRKRNRDAHRRQYRRFVRSGRARTIISFEDQPGAGISTARKPRGHAARFFDYRQGAGTAVRFDPGQTPMCRLVAARRQNAKKAGQNASY